jgi:hypothetical protein
MEIDLTFEEIKINHSELVDTLMEKLNSSTSTQKGKQPREYKWYYSYGVTAKGMSFDEMIHDRKLVNKNSQELLNEQLKSLIGLSLVISDGRVQRYYALKTPPALFVKKFSDLSAKGLEERKKEEERISKLSPEEKEKEIQENIYELNKDDGFVGFNVKPAENKKTEPQEIDYTVDDILDKISKVGMNGLTEGEKKFLQENS